MYHDKARSVRRGVDNAGDVGWAAKSPGGADARKQHSPGLRATVSYRFLKRLKTRRHCYSQAQISPLIVAALSHSRNTKSVGPAILRSKKLEATMFAQLTAEGRVLGFDRGDWLLLVSGFFVAGLLTLLA